MKRIAVTDLEFDKAARQFAANAPEGFECVRAPAREAELTAFVRNESADHVIIGVESYTGPLYQAMAKGSVLARFGIGHDGVDKALASEHGILCANTPGVLDDSVAEQALGLMLCAARRYGELAPEMKQGQWQPRVGFELRGKRLAVIGCGRIGRRVARIASQGFGMTVAGMDVVADDAESLCADWGFSAFSTDFAEVVAEADFVSLHLPSIEATKHYINADRLAQLGRSTWLVNTARGAVVDEAALFDALAQARLGGAALDVFETEPYAPVQPDKDLRTLDNVVLTPHTGSSTQEACDRMALHAMRNIAVAEEGAYDQMDLLNPDVLEKL